MNESMYSYMKVGLIHFMAYPQTMKEEGLIVETIRNIASDAYFNAIEITTVKDPAVRSNVKKLLDTSGMTIAFGAQPQLLSKGLNLNNIDEEARQSAVALCRQLINEAYEMGAAGFSFLSGRYEEKTKQDAFQALVKSTKELCAYAKLKGNMKLALEIFDYNIDKKSLIGPAKLAAAYAKEISSEFDNFGLMVDLSHLPLIGETAAEAILPVREYIIHAHLGNCVVKSPDMAGYGDMHPRFGFPGGENGVEEMIVYLRILLDIGFLNKKAPPVVSFEVKPFGDEDSKIVIANAKRILNLAWARL
jgi:sugar phosphate isomerase/epimerase